MVRDTAEAVRAATVHVVFNVAGALLWLGLIQQLANIAVWMSPIHPELAMADRLVAETPRQIANANTIFNVINTIVFLGFSGVIAKLVIWLVPERRETDTVLVEAKYLDPQLLDTPALALNNVRLELGHMGSHVLEMVAGLRPALANRNLNALQMIVSADDKVDVLQYRILEYLGKMRGKAMSQQEADNFQRMMNATVHLESAGDILESELVPLLRQAIENDRQLSPVMIEMLNSLGETSTAALGHAIDALTREDENLAQDVIGMKEQMRLAMDRIYQYQAQHLDTVGTEEIAIVRLQIEISERLKRLYTLARRIAKEVLPTEVALKSV